jgi:hypothetical protein
VNKPRRANVRRLQVFDGDFFDQIFLAGSLSKKFSSGVPSREITGNRRAHS